MDQDGCHYALRILILVVLVIDALLTNNSKNIIEIFKHTEFCNDKVIFPKRRAFSPTLRMNIQQQRFNFSRAFFAAGRNFGIPSSANIRIVFGTEMKEERFFQKIVSRAIFNE